MSEEDRSKTTSASESAEEMDDEEGADSMVEDSYLLNKDDIDLVNCFRMDMANQEFILYRLQKPDKLVDAAKLLGTGQSVISALMKLMWSISFVFRETGIYDEPYCGSNILELIRRLDNGKLSHSMQRNVFLGGWILSAPLCQSVRYSETSCVFVYLYPQCVTVIRAVRRDPQLEHGIT
jgi:hypothetical protein